MKLFMVHVGFYDEEIGEGIYESHVNFFVAAGNVKSAKKKTFQMEKFKNKKMHIDGIQEINVVQDYQIKLEAANGKSETLTYGYDEINKLSN